MEVIIWQLVVFASVAVVTASKGSRAGLYVAVGWSVWTLAMLFYMPLVLVQLAVAWGAWGLFKTLGDRRDTIRKHEEKIANLEQVIERGLEEYSDQETQQIRSAVEAGRCDVIKDADHKRELDHAVDSANRILVISSGWLSARVVNRGFCRKLDGAMRRGVAVTIYYGWQSHNQQHQTDRSAKEALNSLQKLKRLAGKRGYRGSLDYYEVATHRKLVVVDDEYVVVGSFNWLLNKAVRNAELSVKIYDANLAKQLCPDMVSSSSQFALQSIPI